MGQIVAADGARIAFDEEGEGRPLVLLHGLMAHGGFFEPQRSLADSFRVIRIDLRGHGASQAGRGPTVEAAAGDVAAIAEALDLEGAIGVGWSLGAAILWHVLAGPASARFAGAVVVDMTARVVNNADWGLGLSSDTCEARSQAIREDFPTFAAAAGQAIFADPSPAADWAAIEFARNDPDAIGALWSSLVDQDFRDTLGEIRQPTLVVHGARSHLYGADTADHLVSALPNATAIRFERSGHAPHLEESDLFNTTLRGFAASLPPLPARQTTTV